MKEYKVRDYIAKKLIDPRFRQRVVKDKTKYDRKKEKSWDRDIT